MVFSLPAYRLVAVRGPLIELDLVAYVANLKLLSKLSGGKRQLPVIKANGYGHGAALLAQAIEANFDRKQVPMVCVARWCEAEALRQVGIKIPIIVLSQYSSEEIDSSHCRDIYLYVSNSQDLESLASLKNETQKIAGLYWHINSGMNRLGFDWQMIAEKEEAAKKFIELIKRLKYAGYQSCGFSSHLAKAEEAPEVLSQEQARRFSLSLSAIKKAWSAELGIFPNEIHFSNSAGCPWNLLKEETDNRPGLLTYGMFQDQGSKDFLISKFPDLKDLSPVLTLKAPVRSIQKIEKGDGVSYGHRFLCQEDKWIACIAFGYADGLRRTLGRSASGASELRFFVEGFAADIVGTVTMDMVMVDLTEHPQLEALKTRLSKGDALWAYWLFDGQDAERHAKVLNTITYEITCDFSSRVQRSPLPRAI